MRDNQEERKICPYCGNEMGEDARKITQEHVIPKSLLQLYPEQDITFDLKRNIVNNDGITIGDVCEVCNGGVLSQLDSYGKELIASNFYHPYQYEDYYQVFQIELDTEKFMRWILKILYNEIRREKKPTDEIEKYIPFIMTGEAVTARAGFFLGLHVNLNPMSEEYFGIKPLQINMEPQFFAEDFRRGADQVRFSIVGKKQSFSIRFGNCIVYVVFWDENADESMIEQISETLETEYRFRELKINSNVYPVRCVSSPTNVMLGNYAHFLSEKEVMETISGIEDSLHGRTIPVARQQFEELWDDEMTKEGRAFVEATMFPDNRKKRRMLEKYSRKKSKKGKK